MVKCIVESRLQECERRGGIGVEEHIFARVIENKRESCQNIYYGLKFINKSISGCLYV